MMTAQLKLNKEMETRQDNRNLLEKHVQTLLLSFVTAGMIATFGFLWNLNKEMAIMQERDLQKTTTINNLQQNLQKIQSDFQDFKDQVRETNRLYKAGK
jgi:uncharacterized membrane protein (DUF106 family)